MLADQEYAGHTSIHDDAMAAKLIDAYPASLGARVLREMIEIGGGPDAATDDNLRKLKRQMIPQMRKLNAVKAAVLTQADASDLQPAAGHQVDISDLLGDPILEDGGPARGASAGARANA